jgi:SAM-dependent methyltransferase
MKDSKRAQLKRSYKKLDWIDQPNSFAESALHFMPLDGRILAFTAGHGQDSVFFASEGYDVLATDSITAHLEPLMKKLPEDLDDRIALQAIDLKKPLPLADGSVSIVYGHCSFAELQPDDLSTLFQEIHRVLAPHGMLAFLAPPDTMSIETAKTYTKEFRLLLCDSRGETREGQTAGIHNYVRFIGKRAD